AGVVSTRRAKLSNALKPWVRLETAGTAAAAQILNLPWRLDIPWIYPEGITQQSPGLRGTSYPGSNAFLDIPTPTVLCQDSCRSDVAMYHLDASPSLPMNLA